MEPITVAIVHRSPPIREGLAEMLGRRPDLRVVGAQPTLSALREARCDAGVVLCELADATADGGDAGGSARLLVINVADEDRSIIDCIQVGAAGCVLQDAGLDEIAASILAVASGVPPCSARVVTSLYRYVASRRHEDHPVLAPSLTAREEEVLRLVASGLSNAQIAGRLGLRPQTVKNHVSRVFEKLDVHSRLELIGSLRDLAPGGQPATVPVPR